MKNLLIAFIFFLIPNLFIYSDDQKCKGDCQNGEGEATILRDGKKIAVYKGSFKDGEYYGKGTLKQSDGYIYQGYWQNGKPEGKGKARYASGEKYVGYYKNGEPNGKGKFKDTNGNTYIGEFKSSLYHGKGKKSYSDGSIYTGEWKEDKRHGNGTMVYADGKVYIGKWKEDKRNGKGTLYQKMIFSGNWVNDEPQKEWYYKFKLENKAILYNYVPILYGEYLCYTINNILDYSIIVNIV